ncbi:MAG: Sensor protein [Candidatus Magnetoglobus multicellularis str. Araruama]|uniref:histidine kinase n=1 Tax=Candidatus Magnetoglobus multicellularis str. Araruama TaxID=890399 RepID=A0A1V1PID1_9BACT|nr:MAG: Sensor protein [Candidatus Magnetoglobus multicellularis str. Araruama]
MSETQKNSIFVVDDNDSNIDVLVEALGDEFDIGVALDGETALEDIKFHPPSLILLDIMMPGIDGLEVCRRIKSNKALCDIPIIFLTGKDDLKSKTLGFELGAVDYITKPFQLSELKARVRTHVELKQYRDHIESLVKERTAELEKANANLQELLKNERQLTQKAQASTKAKSNFINIVSHELRTPLNAIIGMNDIIAAADIDPELKEYAGIIKKSSGQLLGIINDILEFSEIETGKITLSSEEFRLDKIIKDVSRIIAQKSGTLLLDIPPDIPNVLIGDEQRLKRIITNLIDNAIKFSKDQLEVTISISHQFKSIGKTQLTIIIKDRGIGICCEDMEKLFKEPFTQVEDAYTRCYGGLGLGLSICKSLVSMMDGNIQVESEPDQGTSFTFTACLKMVYDNIPFEYPEGVTNMNKEQE